MRLTPHFDVAVLGGGPAGCAAALALLQRGISRVAVVESTRYERVRLGESIPPDTRLLFRQLGIWQAFLKEAHDPCLGSCAAWGGEELGHNDFLFNPHGTGWHLDRRRFDAFLARMAVNRGAVLIMDTRFAGVERGCGDFSLSLTGAFEKKLRARFVVDATGKGAHFARQMKARPGYHDRLVCVTGFLKPMDFRPFSRLTMLEAEADGWWYAAKIPNGLIAVSFASDPDIVKRGGFKRERAWLARLRATKHIAETVKGCELLQGLSPAAAPSFLMDKVCGEGWLALGDAASAYDPISSQGIHKALAEGLTGAGVIQAYLRGNRRALDDYPTTIQHRFQTYLNNRNYFYGLERRWPTSAFWSRRRKRSAA